MLKMKKLFHNFILFENYVRVLKFLHQNYDIFNSSLSKFSVKFVKNLNLFEDGVEKLLLSQFFFNGKFKILKIVF